MITTPEILTKIKNHPLQKIKLAVADIDGVLRGKMVRKAKFLDIAETSLGFCDVIFGWDMADNCYDNITYTGWHTGYPDASVTLDLQTYRQIPWQENIPLVLGDLDNSNICPRSLLRKLIKDYENLGYIPLFAQEFEWFNFEETPQSLSEKKYQNLNPLTPDMFGYSMLRPSLKNNYFNALFDELEKFNIPLEGLHTETGPGVYEAAILYDEVLSAADKAVLFKTAVKEIAYQHGVIATFMAKWNADLSGSSGHLHQSIWDKNRTQNLFFDANDSHNMSDLFKSYLAGQLYCLPYILPMFAPTVNSYKRLKEGTWAPATLTWGVDNRTTAYRVLNKSPKAIRLENRVAGADINPYLAMAGALASGLYGIQHNLSLEIPEIKGDGYKNTTNEKLPKSLLEATQKMQNSTIANQILGESFVQHFTQTREWEWREFSDAITDWEVKRYFELI